MRALLAWIVTTFTLTATAAAQSTSFTYQGRLTDGGQPASGLHDFRFRLFDAASGGTQVGSTLCANDTTVADGLFATTLDFGQQFATPSGRFLEIFVRADTGSPCSDDFGYVLLTPRQPLTAAPLASHARSAFALDAPDGSPASALFVDNAGNVGIGTAAPTAKLDIRGPLSVANTGNGADLLWLNSERSWVFRQDGSGATTDLKLQSVGGGGNKSFFFQTDGVVGLRSTLGSTRYLPSGAENLHFARGTVDAGGEVSAGLGFTSARAAQGVYQINYPLFSSLPTVFVTPAANGLFLVCASNITTTGCTVVMRVADGGAVDSDFSFLVFGPR